MPLFIRATWILPIGVYNFQFPKIVKLYVPFAFVSFSWVFESEVKLAFTTFDLLLHLIKKNLKKKKKNSIISYLYLMVAH